MPYRDRKIGPAELDEKILKTIRELTRDVTSDRLERYLELIEDRLTWTRESRDFWQAEAFRHQSRGVLTD